MIPEALPAAMYKPLLDTVTTKMEELNPSSSRETEPNRALSCRLRSLISLLSFVSADEVIDVTGTPTPSTEAVYSSAAYAYRSKVSRCSDRTERKARTWTACAISHSLSTPSLEPDTAIVEPRINFTQCTVLSWPFITPICEREEPLCGVPAVNSLDVSSVGMLQTRTVRSAPPETATVGDPVPCAAVSPTSTQRTRPLWP